MNNMNNDVIIKIGKRVAILVLFISIIFLFIFQKPKPIILGLIFGSIISILSLKLIDNIINKAVRMTPRRASGYTMGHLYARYLIYGTVLIIGEKADYLNFLSTAFGLLTVKIVIVFSNIFDKNFHKR